MEKPDIEKILRDVSASPDLKESIAAFRQLSKSEKLKLINSLKDLKTEAAAAYLNSLYEGEPDKDIQKQMRKLLFTLKTMGIKTAEPKAAAAPTRPVLKKIEEVRQHRALLSSYDDENTRLVLAAFELKKNTFMLLSAADRLFDGLMELMSGAVDRAGLEDILREYTAGRPRNMTVVRISPKYAGYLMVEASARSGKNREEIKQLKTITANIKDGIEKPEDIYNLPVPETDRSLPLERILEHSIFEPVSLKWSTAEEDKTAYNSTGGSAIILPPYMLEEKRQELVEKLSGLDELKAKIQSIRRLLEDYAYIFYSLGEMLHYKGLIEYLKSPDALGAPSSTLSGNHWKYQGKNRRG